MSALVFDTLKLADALKAADFTETQAKGLVAALTDTAQDSLATKPDIAALRSDMAALRSEIATFRVDTAKWIIGAVAFNFLATAGLFATLCKLSAK